jgi:predicted MPP superfamily phosphohydrolase
MSIAGERHLAEIPAAPIDTQALEPAEVRVDRPVRGPWLQVGSIHRFEWNRLALPIARLPDALDGLRILHVSDLHFRPVWFDGYDQVLGQIAHNPPHLILITGDFVEARADHRPARPFLERFLTQLKSRLGIFGILGNHDGDLLGPRLGQMGVTLINGRTARLESADAAIELIGVPGVSRRDLTRDFLDRIGPKRDTVPRIVLSHYPDAIRRLAPLRADVVLSGHTHGGQICLPNGFAPLTHDSLPRRMSKGVHRMGDTWLVVSRGAGFATWRVRAFCPAEVVEIELKREP